MNKSASIIGRELYNLNREESTMLFKIMGLLKGVPGDWDLTNKAHQYAKTTDMGNFVFHSWNDACVDYLRNNVTDDHIRIAKEMVKQSKEIVKQSKEIANPINENINNISNAVSNDTTKGFLIENKENIKKVIIAGAFVLIGYGIYKYGPKLVKYIKNKKKQHHSSQKSLKKLKTMICPNCGETMFLDEYADIWRCVDCDYNITNQKIKSGEVFWFCDECDSFLNIQKGFTTKDGNWICTDCGFDNDVTDDNIII